MAYYSHHRPGYKQALIGTTLSALLHAAATDDDEPMLREVMRGAGKGMGADLGMLLGGLTGAGIGGRLGFGAGDAPSPGQVVKDLENASPEHREAIARDAVQRVGDTAQSTGLGLLGGGFLGAGAGGVGGYLLADKLIDSIGKKKQKIKA
jgi:hypothetical protein